MSEPPEPQPPVLSGFESKKSHPLALVFFGLAFAAGYFGMRAFPLQIRMRMYAGGAVGLLVALVPFFIARKRRLHKLAAISLLAGAGVGVLGGALLAVPLAIVLTVIALRKTVI